MSNLETAVLVAGKDSLNKLNLEGRIVNRVDISNIVSVYGKEERIVAGTQKDPYLEENFIYIFDNNLEESKRIKTKEWVYDVIITDCILAGSDQLYKLNKKGDLQDTINIGMVPCLAASREIIAAGTVDKATGATGLSILNSQSRYKQHKIGWVTAIEITEQTILVGSEGIYLFDLEGNLIKRKCGQRINDISVKEGKIITADYGKVSITDQNLEKEKVYSTEDWANAVTAKENIMVGDNEGVHLIDYEGILIRKKEIGRVTKVDSVDDIILAATNNKLYFLDKELKIFYQHSELGGNYGCHADRRFFVADLKK